MYALVVSAVFASLMWSSDGCAATPAVTTSPCRSCGGDTITITTDRGGAKPMDGDVIDRTTGTCATRTFTCLGAGSNIEINGGQGVVFDGDDGTVDGTTTFVVTCDTAGTAWVNSGVTITQVECAIA